ncbi:hypothetical protein KLP40_14085 [Hymenobacter sp. NST-14]|uniref:M15 family metallopeptidase n=1 Tax=Hymenobacter piscis TaxID=2839984 RepID=UPI001C02B50E|nr:M15 family metallopeptidase [Hymenobacter piscis]MBT9394297.1 hypothetical protein [Hymenobacter piscis]
MTLPSSGFTIVSSAADYRRRLAVNGERELVDLAVLIPEIVLDLRFATAHNVLGRPLYSQARALLRRPVAEALQGVQQVLREWGLSLCVFDAYRPYSLTRVLAQDSGTVKTATSPWNSLPRNRGCAVDVGLVEVATRRPVPLPTDFGEELPAAHSGFGQLPPHVLFNRSVLLAAMKQQGFQNYPGQWWHFAHHRWPDFDLLDLPFEEL